MLSQCQRFLALSRSAERVSFTRAARCANRQARWMSTQSDADTSELSQATSSTPSESIFSASAGSAWDEIFRAENGSSSSSKPFAQPQTSDQLPKPVRRQTITERESKVITDMLDMIFNKRRPTDDTSSHEKTSSSKNVISSGDQAGVGGGGHIDDLFGRLRRHSRPLRWAQEPTADLLDQKKEQMMLCNSDQELLDWAQREVFRESRRYEEAAKKAIETAPPESGPVKLPSLQSPVYPQVVAHLMQTFRDHYRDPNLALFIFHHTQKLSIVSYVFGCSTQVYNEFIKTLWNCFRDLHGVYNAVEEMVVNGVPLDSTTRKLIEIVRRDIGAVELSSDVNGEAQRSVWSLLSKIERRVASNLLEKPQETKVWDRWKSDVLTEGISQDDWAFDDWLPPEKEVSYRKRKALNTRRALSRV